MSDIPAKAGMANNMSLSKLSPKQILLSSKKRLYFWFKNKSV